MMPLAKRDMYYYTIPAKALQMVLAEKPHTLRLDIERDGKFLGELAIFKDPENRENIFITIGWRYGFLKSLWLAAVRLWDSIGTSSQAGNDYE